MTAAQRTRYEAARLLALAASNAPMTLDQLAAHAGLVRNEAAVRLARRAIANAVGAGTWREVRAEAEAAVRSGR